jgi:hypothetical protein
VVVKSIGTIKCDEYSYDVNGKSIDSGSVLFMSMTLHELDKARAYQVSILFHI